jgi:hypothetical protein
LNRWMLIIDKTSWILNVCSPKKLLLKVLLSELLRHGSVKSLLVTLVHLIIRWRQRVVIENRVLRGISRSIRELRDASVAIKSLRFHLIRIEVSHSTVISFLSPLSVSVLCFCLQRKLCEILKGSWDFLISLSQNFDQIWSKTQFFGCNERVCDTLCSSSSRSSNSMNIIFNSIGHIIVKHDGDIFDIKTSTGDICGQQDI